jgi:hypothetical protein
MQWWPAGGRDQGDDRDNTSDSDADHVRARQTATA